MKLNEYQDSARETAVYPYPERIEYTALGIAGEAGEYCNKIKKGLRGDFGVQAFEYMMSTGQIHSIALEDYKHSLAEELGDVLWYVANAAYELGYSLDEIAELNLSKLAERKQKGTIKGSGDER